MELWGCVVVAQLAAQAGMRVRPRLAGKALVVMEGVRPTERVCSVNVRARAMGLREGMTRVEVETFEDVAVLAQSAAEEAAATRVQVEAMSRFSPRVEANACGTDWECVVDLAGTERLMGNPFTIGCQIVASLEELGFAAFCCVAANPDAGLSVARFGAWCLGELEEAGRLLGATSSLRLHAARVGSSVRVMERGQEGWALAGLPVAVLRLEEEMRERFAIWGVRTLGELAGLPETALIVRVGQIGKTLRLRARGELPYFMKPLEEEFRLEELMELEEPVDTLEPLLFLIDSMLALLLKRVVGRALALASVTVSFLLQVSADRLLGMDEEREQGRETALANANKAVLRCTQGDETGGLENGAGMEGFSRTVRPAVATVDPTLLMKMLQLDLEAHPAPGAVVRVRVAAETGDASRIQLGLFAPQMPEPTRFEDTHARLVSLVGEGNVGRVRLLDTHAPEAFVLERFVLPSAEYKASPPRSERTTPVTALRRLRPALQVRVSMKGAEILGFWLEGRRFEVMRCYGPWRSSGAWWAGNGWSEDTWDLATRCDADGEVMVCLLGHDLVRDAWCLEGVYD
jgi:protein ImuB